MKAKILVFTDWYYPGYKAGGPIQSCHNIVKTLSGQYSFYILTSDRDLGEANPYPGIQADTWTESVYHEKVMYASPGFLNVSVLHKMIRELRPDIIYFNSMFSRSFTLLPLLTLRLIRFGGRMILAPRGMLHSGALQQKGLKKKLFLQFFRLTGLPGRLQFHATDQQELKDIKSFFPKASVKLASNIPNVDNAILSVPVKQKDDLHAVFISRIHPKKNLHFLLELFRDIKPAQKLTFDIYGVADDEVYTMQCKQLASTLPGNVLVKFHGPLASRDVLVTLKKSHVFMLPTFGENFGHAIFESLTAGRPILVSDQTPWKSLSKAKAGWDLPLTDKQGFLEAIDRLLNMEQDEFNDWVKGAKQHSEDFLSQQDYLSSYSKLFNEAGN